MGNINLNLLIIFFIAIYILQGVHKGFLISAFNTVGMGVSWIVGFLFSPILSKNIAGSSFYTFLQNFTESSDRLAVPTDANLAVVALSPADIERIVSTSKLPMPFDKLVQQNMVGQVFESQGLHTVSDYLNTTIANVVVNIFSFLIIYLIARIIIALFINAYNFASPIPVLKKYDSLIGGGVGALRGFFGMFSLFIIVPVLLIAMPLNLDIFHNMVYGSSMAQFFYESNFLLQFVSGVI